MIEAQCQHGGASPQTDVADPQKNEDGEHSVKPHFINEGPAVDEDRPAGLADEEKTLPDLLKRWSLARIALPVIFNDRDGIIERSDLPDALDEKSAGALFAVRNGRNDEPTDDEENVDSEDHALAPRLVFAEPAGVASKYEGIEGVVKNYCNRRQSA